MSKPAAPAGAYGYFEHVADVGVIGRGPSVERAFEAAAQAMFAIMAPTQQVACTHRIAVDFEEGDVELALVTWLNALLAQARADGLALGRFRLTRDGDRWQGEAEGAPWDGAIERGTEVKGATLTMLSVRRTAEGWTARCVVDV